MPPLRRHDVGEEKIPIDKRSLSPQGASFMFEYDTVRLRMLQVKVEKMKIKQKCCGWKCTQLLHAIAFAEHLARYSGGRRQSVRKSRFTSVAWFRIGDAGG